MNTNSGQEVWISTTDLENHMASFGQPGYAGCFSPKKNSTRRARCSVRIAGTLNADQHRAVSASVR